MNTHSLLSLSAVVFLVGLGTFLIRQSFLGPWARGELPSYVQKALKLAPPVIFAALIAPMLFYTDGVWQAGTNSKKIIAAAACFAYAAWRGGQIMPLLVGMGSLHLLHRLY
ncbi:MAG: hypothetical protein RLZZ502_1756 [Pseudomonadota bacterium]|jgi:branched-subunit amino acid transport protein